MEELDNKTNMVDKQMIFLRKLAEMLDNNGGDV